MKSSDLQLNKVKLQLSDMATQVTANKNAISGISASPRPYATLTALQTAYPAGDTKVYVVAEDGKWYYWSGSAWTAGGTYQGIVPGNYSNYPIYQGTTTTTGDNQVIEIIQFLKKGVTYNFRIIGNGASNYISLKLVTKFNAGGYSYDTGTEIANAYNLTDHTFAITPTQDYAGIAILAVNARNWTLTLTSSNDNPIQLYYDNRKSILEQYYKPTKKIAILGDSIMSNMASLIADQSKMTMLAVNSTHCFAIGNAQTADYFTDSTNVTPINLTTVDGTASYYNVLSNQIRRLAQWTATSGAQITWTNPSDNTTVSIDTSYGTGLGHTDDVPDIIYISIGTNDTNWTDDFDTVETQAYSSLNRSTMASALRWAIESLQCLYPCAIIYVATPLKTGYPLSDTSRFGYTAGKAKREIIKKVAEMCGVYCVDVFAEVGLGRLTPTLFGESAGSGLHPNTAGNFLYSRYIAKQINNGLYNKKDDTTLLYD